MNPAAMMMNGSGGGGMSNMGMGGGVGGMGGMGGMNNMGNMGINPAALMGGKFVPPLCTTSINVAQARRPR